MKRKTNDREILHRSCVRKSQPFKKRYIFFAVLIAIMLFAGIKIYEHWQTITLYYSAINTSSEEIHALQKTNEEKIDAALNEITDIQVRNLTQEEQEQLSSGVLSQEEATALILGTNLTDTTAKPEQTQNGQEKDHKTPASQSVSRKNEIIAQIYLLRSEFLGKIDNALNEQIAIYRKYPPKERTMTLKLQMADAVIAKGVALENQCDARMNTLLSELEWELIKNGEDTSQIDTARALYAEAKRIKKAELLAEYYPG